MDLKGRTWRLRGKLLSLPIAVLSDLLQGSHGVQYFQKLLKSPFPDSYSSFQALSEAPAPAVP